MTPATAIITMAGVGRRFREAGYTRPKYEIEVQGQTLFAWSMESLRSFIDAGSPFVFVTRKEDDATAFVANACRLLGIVSHDVIELDRLTDGQATSALLAETVVANPDAPAFIYNIDTHVSPNRMPASAVRGEGWIPCFRGEGDAWSFARTDASGKVLEMREKVRISPFATVGLYWFGSFRLYSDTYRKYYADPARLEAGERYIAPMYNQLIADGLEVYMHEIPIEAVVPLGTPAEVERFKREAERDGITPS